MSGVLRRIRGDERGASAVILGVSLTALFGVSMLAVDAGSLWSTRRAIITGTDAAALHAAQYFDSGVGSPCNSADLTTAEDGATTVMRRNQPNALHDAVETPNGFQVTTAVACGTASYIPGKVRYDGRLQAAGFFSKMFGFGDSKPFSSSTAAWGYITAIGEGLRPIALCDTGENYRLWSDFWFKRITVDDYRAYFGRDEALADYRQIRFPSSSDHWINGPSAHNPNGKGNKRYTVPTSANGFGPVHRITMPDATCGDPPGFTPSGDRVWVDFTDAENGAVGASVLRDWLLQGYKGTVSLSPAHDCNPNNNIVAPEDCGGAPGDKATLEQALGTITCDKNVQAMQCPYIFPILVVDRIAESGANIHYDQVAFLTVVLRGFGDVQSHDLQFDFEFVDVKVSGEIGAAPADTTHPYQTGIQLCGADHDPRGGDRCPF